MSPDGERIELFEDAATNLTFTPDAGPATGIALRHRQPVGKPIAFHHIHLYLPDAAAVAAAKAWYATWFGGVPGKRAQYDAVDLPGSEPQLLGRAQGRSCRPRAARWTTWRSRCASLGPLCARLAEESVAFERPCQVRAGRRSATIVDPWGASIELTEPTGRS